MPSHRSITADPGARGLFTLIAALGIIAGATHSLIYHIPAIAELRRHGPVDLVLTAAFVLTFAVLLNTITQRLRTVLLAALLFGFTCQLSMIITNQLLNPRDRGASLLSWIWVGFLFASTLIGVITALAALAARAIIRATALILHDDAEPRCPSCGYTAHGLAVCPECGRDPTPKASPIRTASLSAPFQRRARPIFIAVLALMLGAIALGLFTDGMRIHRFESAFDTSQPTAGIMEGVDANGSPRQIWTTGSWQDFPGSSSRGVMIGYLTEDQPGMPAMQLWAARRAGRSTTASTPSVFCSLNRAQADQVLKNGLPTSLLEVMRSTEDDLIARRAGEDRVEIDPTPHFSR